MGLVKSVISTRTNAAVPFDQIDELISVLICKSDKTPDVCQHDLFKIIYADIMGGRTGALSAVVIGTVEIPDIAVSLIKAEVEITAAIRTNK